jgi:hypothetical protein
MRRALPFLATLALLSNLVPLPVNAGIPFTETHDDGACCPLVTNFHIRREVPLMGGPFFLRHELTSFQEEDLLPVENAGDFELLWDNGAGGDGSSLALTDDDEEGNYDFEDVTLTTAFAMQGDLAAALPEAGVVVRHTGPEFLSPRKFYCVFGRVTPGGAVGLQIQFFLRKWEGLGFVALDSGPADSELYDYTAAQNFRLSLQVTGPDAGGQNQLAACFERLSVVGGALEVEPLACLTGIDDDLMRGQIGLYTKGGSVHTEIAFDDGVAAVAGATPARPTTWGWLKAIYR